MSLASSLFFVLIRDTVKTRFNQTTSISQYFEQAVDNMARLSKKILNVFNRSQPSFDMSTWQPFRLSKFTPLTNSQVMLYFQANYDGVCPFELDLGQEVVNFYLFMFIETRLNTNFIASGLFLG
jgi:hypothetical protein